MLGRYSELLGRYIGEIQARLAEHLRAEDVEKPHEELAPMGEIWGDMGEIWGRYRGDGGARPDMLAMYLQWVVGG